MRLRTIACLGILICVLSGCVHGVAWLADSSGFVFTHCERAPDRLRHRDEEAAHLVDRQGCGWAGRYDVLAWDES